MANESDDRHRARHKRRRSPPSDDDDTRRRHRPHNRDELDRKPKKERRRSPRSSSPRQAHGEAPKQRQGREAAKNADSGEGDELSVEETNKLRAKLGLTLLPTGGGGAPASSTAEADYENRDDVHVPAENLAEKREARRIRERLEQMRERRRLEKKILSAKSVGARSRADDDMEAWVARSRSLDDERRRAVEREHILKQMDDEFGISDLVDEEMARKRDAAYTARDLSGLTVEHDIDRLGSGEVGSAAVILTLKDADVLAASDDTLVNPNIVDDEKAEQNAILRGRKPAHLNPFQEAADELYAPGAGAATKSILSKYNDEIDGEKKKSFVLWTDGDASAPQGNDSSFARHPTAKIAELSLPAFKTADEYATGDECVSFKKSTKREKKRKTRRAGAFVEDFNDASTRFASSSINLEEPGEDYAELEQFLDQTRRRGKAVPAFPTDSLDPVKEEPGEVLAYQPDVVVRESGQDIVLDETSEFCRSIGLAELAKAEAQAALPEAKVRPSATTAHVMPEESMDVVAESKPARAFRGGWEEASFETEQPHVGADGRLLRHRRDAGGDAAAKRADSDAYVGQHPEGDGSEEAVVLDEEPAVGKGLFSTLQLAARKGMLEYGKKAGRVGTADRNLLEAQSYSIEDKRLESDDKRRGLERPSSGPIMPFRDKDTYNPSFKLEYRNESGRELSEKEAFRELSHKFHGKKPGKQKAEKRTKKLEEKLVMMKMSSTDTPLNTVERMKQKQKDIGCAYLVLSGGKESLDSLSKAPSKRTSSSKR